MGLTKIMGESVATKSQLLAYFNAKNKSPKLKCTISELIDLYLKESKSEGVRGDIAFAQACLETGFFKYGGIVKWEQNNYCGLGALDGSSSGKCATFESPKIGVRAHIQHLKAYATKTAPVNTIVDPRYKYVTKGSAEYVEYLGIPDNPKKVGWATRKGYGKLILDVLNEALKYKATETTSSSKTETIKNESVTVASNYKLNIDGFDISKASIAKDSKGSLYVSLDSLKDRIDITIENATEINMKTKPMYIKG